MTVFCLIFLSPPSGGRRTKSEVEYPSRFCRVGHEGEQEGEGGTRGKKLRGERERRSKDRCASRVTGVRDRNRQPTGFSSAASESRRILRMSGRFLFRGVGWKQLRAAIRLPRVSSSLSLSLSPLSPLLLLLRLPLPHRERKAVRVVNAGKHRDVQDERNREEAYRSTSRPSPSPPSAGSAGKRVRFFAAFSHVESLSLSLALS